VQNAIQLRQFLTERFPRIRLLSELDARPARACHATGVPQVDGLLGGGLPKGALTEAVRDPKKAGSALLLCSILRETRQQWVGLIDGCDSFDPASLEFKPSRLLWIRCQEAAAAVKSADLLLRDGNLPLLILDLGLNPAKQLRKIPATSWYRLQRLIEQKSTAMLVITPRPMVSSAHARLFLSADFSLNALEERREVLLSQMKVALQTRHSHSEPAQWAQAG